MPQQSNSPLDESEAQPRDSALQQRLRRVNTLANQLAAQRAATLPAASPLAPAPAPAVVRPAIPSTPVPAEALPAATDSSAVASPSTILFTLTSDDLIAAEIYRVHHVPAVRRQQRIGRLWWLAITSCLGGVFILLVLLNIHWLILTIVGWFASLALTILLNDLLLKNYSIKRMIQKAERAGTYRDMLVQQQVSVSAEGYTIVSPHVEVKITWQIVKQIAVTDTHIYLFTSEVGANIIPKRAFADSAAADTFIQQIRNHRSAVRHQTSPE